MKRIVLFFWNLFVPVAMPEDTPAQRANKRRAFMVRNVVCILFLGVAIALPAILANDDPLISFGIAADIFFMVSALVVNRLGLQWIAGVLCVLAVIVSTLSPILASPLAPALFPLLNSLVISVIVAGLVLPAFFILLVGCLNAGIIFCIVFFLPHAPALDILLADSPMGLSVPPIVLEIMVALLTFFLIRQLQQVIEKSEQQEEMLRLQRVIAEQEQREVEKARLLEERIVQLAQTLMQISTGNLEAHAMVTQGNVLWPIADPLNALLNRARDWRQDDTQCQRMQIAAQHLAQQISIAWQQRMPVQFPITDTPWIVWHLRLTRFSSSCIRSQIIEIPGDRPL